MKLYALRNGEGPAWALEHPPSRPGHGRGCFLEFPQGSSRRGQISPGAGAAGLLRLQISVAGAAPLHEGHCHHLESRPFLSVASAHGPQTEVSAQRFFTWSSGLKGQV